jgi:uncharacterized protein (TIGR02246 family)
MRVPRALLLLTSLATSTGAAAAAAQDARPVDGALPRAIDAGPARIAAGVLGRLDSAWNAASGTRFAAEFTDDADVININGTHFRGRADIGARMQAILDTRFKGSTHRARTLELARSLADGMIIVVSSAVIAVPAGPLAPEAKSRQTFILVNTGQAWQIRHWHNTPLRDER